MTGNRPLMKLVRSSVIVCASSVVVTGLGSIASKHANALESALACKLTDADLRALEVIELSPIKG